MKKIISVFACIALLVGLSPITSVKAEGPSSTKAQYTMDGGTTWSDVGTDLVSTLTVAGDAVVNIPTGAAVTYGIGTISGLTSLKFTGAGTLDVLYCNGIPTEIDGITVTGSVYGGAALNTSSTSLTITSGTLNVVYGGNPDGSTAVIPSTTINASGGTITFIYGGGYSHVDTTNVTLSGTVHLISNVMGGGYGNNGTVGTSNVIVNGGTLYTVYGAGYGTHVDTTNVTVNGGSCYSVYGGGYGSDVTNAHVTINGGTVHTDSNGGTVGGGGYGGFNDESLYTGTSSSHVANATVIITGGTMDRVYAGGSRKSNSEIDSSNKSGAQASVTDASSVTISGNPVIASLYQNDQDNNADAYGRRGATATNVTNNITGGSFGNDPTKYLSTGYTYVLNNGKYEVVVKTAEAETKTTPGPFLITFLDASGNTVKVEWVEYGGSATAPTGYGEYTGYTNVTENKDIRPITVSSNTYAVPNTADKSY